jgi:hypothetical protein
VASIYGFKCLSFIHSVYSLIKYQRVINNRETGAAQSTRDDHIECSFKFLLKAGDEESIVNAPRVRLQSTNTNKAKSEVRLKQLIP